MRKKAVRKTVRVPAKKKARPRAERKARDGAMQPGARNKKIVRGYLEEVVSRGDLDAIDRYARAKDPRIVQVMAHLGGEYEVVLIARADGGIAADVRPLDVSWLCDGCGRSDDVPHVHAGFKYQVIE